MGKELAVLRLLLTNHRVPRLSKWLLAAALAYAVSPIDLIPDFIPVLGQADDVLIVAGLCWLAYRLIPREVISACRRETGLAP
ncbi:MAG: hypothetical protein CMM50_02010 [Rhodospirillaceae bacterium]|nr:hypothetical protein [Rhodospirillaceae bacterium]